MNYEVYQDLKEQVSKEDFYTKYKGLKNWLYRLSWIGNIFCIVFAYFHVNNAILMTLTNPTSTTIVAITLLTIGVLFALEGLKRVIFSKLTKSFIENRLRWTGAELNTLGIFALLLVGASFYLSLTGAKEYADKKQQVITEISNKVDSYQDTLSVKYDKKIKVLEDRNNKLFDETRLLSEQARNEVGSASKRMLKEVATNNSLMEHNNVAVKELKQEKEKELAKYDARQKEKNKDVISQSDDNIVRFVSFSAIAEVLILLGVAFRGYFPYRSKIEFDKIIESEPKYRQFEIYNQLINVIYRNGVKIGDNIITKTEITKMLRITGVDLYGKQLDDSMRVLRHLKIIQQRGSKGVVKCEIGTARILVRDYLNIK